jgi:hypothetical protein
MASMGNSGAQEKLIHEKTRDENLVSTVSKYFEPQNLLIISQKYGFNPSSGKKLMSDRESRVQKNSVVDPQWFQCRSRSSSSF